MRIGVDFDNTIAGYDNLFRVLAAEAGLAPPPDATGDVESRTALRDRLRATGDDGEIAWQRLQAAAYGPRMEEAELMAGVREFLHAAGARGAALFVVSHKTRFARRDEAQCWDMQAAARAWMKSHGLLGPDAFNPQNVFFESSRDDKVRRIVTLGCTHFIDDLQEVFAHPAFPANVAGYLIDPAAARPDAVGGRRCFSSWRAIHDDLFGVPG